MPPACTLTAAAKLKRLSNQPVVSTSGRRAHRRTEQLQRGDAAIQRHISHPLRAKCYQQSFSGSMPSNKQRFAELSSTCRPSGVSLWISMRVHFLRAVLTSIRKLCLCARAGAGQVAEHGMHARDNEVDVLRAREVANSGVRHVGGLVRCDHVVKCAVHHMYIIA